MHFISCVEYKKYFIRLYEKYLELPNVFANSIIIKSLRVHLDRILDLERLQYARTAKFNPFLIPKDMLGRKLLNIIVRPIFFTGRYSSKNTINFISVVI